MEVSFLYIFLILIVCILYEYQFKVYCESDILDYMFLRVFIIDGCCDVLVEVQFGEIEVISV